MIFKPRNHVFQELGPPGNSEGDVRSQQARGAALGRGQQGVHDVSLETTSRGLPWQGGKEPRTPNLIKLFMLSRIAQNEGRELKSSEARYAEINQFAKNVSRFLSIG